MDVDIRTVRAIIVTLLAVFSSYESNASYLSQEGTSYETCGEVIPSRELATWPTRFLGRVTEIKETERARGYLVSFDITHDFNSEGSLTELTFDTNSHWPVFSLQFNVGETYLIFAQGKQLDSCNGVFSFSNFASDELRKLSQLLGDTEANMYQYSSSQELICRRIELQEFVDSDFDVVTGQILRIIEVKNDIVEFEFQVEDGTRKILYAGFWQFGSTDLGDVVTVMFNQASVVSNCLISPIHIWNLSAVDNVLFTYKVFSELQNN